MGNLQIFKDFSGSEIQNQKQFAHDELQFVAACDTCLGLVRDLIFFSTRGIIPALKSTHMGFIFWNSRKHLVLFPLNTLTPSHWCRSFSFFRCREKEQLKRWWVSPTKTFSQQNFLPTTVWEATLPLHIFFMISMGTTYWQCICGGQPKSHVEGFELLPVQQVSATEDRPQDCPPLGFRQDRWHHGPVPWLGPRSIFPSESFGLYRFLPEMYDIKLLLQKFLYGFPLCSD